MKNNYYIISLLIIASVGIFSCREPIDITVPDTQKKIVLNGLINPDSTVKLNLSKSISILEKDDKITFLENADVKLYEDDIFKENLQYDINGYYRGTVYPQIGKTYKITAEYSPLDAVDAETEILSAPIISDINAEPIFYSEIQTWYDSETGEPFDTTINTLSQVKINITLSDPPNQTNYYLLTFSANLAQYTQYPPDYEPIFIGYKMTNLYYDANNLNWENHFYTRDLMGYVFCDNLFDGQNYSINASVYPDGYYSSGYTEGDNALDRIYVNLHAVTEDFYQYVISYSKYQETEGNPLAEPVNIRSNVNNGFGFFSGYSTKTDSVMIDYSGDK